MSDSTTTPERTAMLQELIGETCRCGRKKRRRETFCRGCYYALSSSDRKRLYDRFGEGYETAYKTAVEILDRKGGSHVKH
jgi:hypothetical protein